MTDRAKAAAVAAQLRGAVDQVQDRIFLCFGSLLSWVRDQDFPGPADIDLGVITVAPDVVIGTFSQIYTPQKIIRMTNGAPLQATFLGRHGETIDVYFWHKKDGYYYHAYDHNHVNPPSGVLPEYEFKGLPVGCFDAPAEAITYYKRDPRYGRAMTSKGTWLKPVPSCPEEGVELPLPWSYGHCLDVWYPDWATKRPQFGVSEAAHRFKVTNTQGVFK